MFYEPALLKGQFVFTHLILMTVLWALSEAPIH